MTGETEALYTQAKLLGVTNAGLHAMFTVESVTAENIILRDTGHEFGRRSITNDVEWIIATLAPYLGERDLFYYDSDGELTHAKRDGNRFLGFAAVPTRKDSKVASDPAAPNSERIIHMHFNVPAAKVDALIKFKQLAYAGWTLIEEPAYAKPYPAIGDYRFVYAQKDTETTTGEEK